MMCKRPFLHVAHPLWGKLLADTLIPAHHESEELLDGLSDDDSDFEHEPISEESDGGVGSGCAGHGSESAASSAGIFAELLLAGPAAELAASSSGRFFWVILLRFGGSAGAERIQFLPAATSARPSPNLLSRVSGSSIGTFPHFMPT